jgi:hypothetical protein
MEACSWRMGLFSHSHDANIEQALAGEFKSVMDPRAIQTSKEAGWLTHACPWRPEPTTLSTFTLVPDEHQMSGGVPGCNGPVRSGNTATQQRQDHPQSQFGTARVD